MISVCMITYNGAKFIKEQIDSILKQLSPTDELIISDDGSTDETIEIIESYQDPRIKLYKNNSFKNPTFNMQNALYKASGDIILMSDQDDVWLDDKVKIMTQYLKEADYVVSDCYITDENLNIIYNSRFIKETNIKKNKYLALLFFPTPYQGGCVAFKRKILKKALPIPSYIQSHDRWIGNVAAFYYSIKIVPEKLIYYRMHSSNYSLPLGKSKNNFFNKVLFRLGYVIGLIQILFRFKK